LSFIFENSYQFEKSARQCSKDDIYDEGFESIDSYDTWKSKEYMKMYQKQMTQRYG
jgi:hypothetical protein